jgi:hypothetical protein
MQHIDPSLEEYVKLFLESDELDDEEVDEMTTVASVGSMGYSVPLGATSKKNDKKS